MFPNEKLSAEQISAIVDVVEAIADIYTWPIDEVPRRVKELLNGGIMIVQTWDSLVAGLSEASGALSVRKVPNKENVALSAEGKRGQELVQRFRQELVSLNRNDCFPKYCSMNPIDVSSLMEFLHVTGRFFPGGGLVLDGVSISPHENLATNKFLWSGEVQDGRSADLPSEAQHSISRENKKEDTPREPVTLEAQRLILWNDKKRGIPEESAAVLAAIDRGQELMKRFRQEQIALSHADRTPKTCRMHPANEWYLNVVLHSRGSPIRPYSERNAPLEIDGVQIIPDESLTLGEFVWN